MVDGFLTFVTFVVFLVTLFNKEVAHKLEAHWHGLSRWYSIIPVAALLVYRLMRANYTHFESCVKQVDRLTERVEKDERTHPYISLSVRALQIQVAARSASNHRLCTFEVFLEVDTELQTSGEVEVSQYELEVISHSASTRAHAIDDMREWHLLFPTTYDDGGARAIITHELKPLPTRLTAGIPVIGWLHFQTERMIEDDMRRSELRLTAVAPAGSNHTELLQTARADTIKTLIHKRNPAESGSR